MLPKDIPFEDAWDIVKTAVDLFTQLGILPFAFMIPAPAGRAGNWPFRSKCVKPPQID